MVFIKVAKISTLFVNCRFYGSARRVYHKAVAVLACLAAWAYTPSGALFGSSMSPPLSTTFTPGPKVRVRVTLALTLQRPLEDEPT